MARRGTEQRKLTKQLNVRLPTDLHARIRLLAAADGITDAAWTRALVARTIDPPSSILAPICRRPRAMPTPDVIAIARLREAVGEAVGTLRQVAGLDRAKEGGRLLELDDAISRLISLATELDEVKARLLGRAS